MTSPTTSPGPLYYLLSLYAAVDEAVITSTNETASETVERLPGTSGDNAGWSVSLTELVGPMAPLAEALEGIANGPRLSIPELSRLVFIIGVLIRLGHADEHNRSFTDVIALAGPEGIPEGTQHIERGGQLRDWLDREFWRWQDWDKAKGAPVEEGFLDARVPQVPLCNAYLSEEDGAECVVIDTLFKDEVLTVQQVKDVLDLSNWDDVAGKYFKEMIPLRPDRTDGWSRILEVTDITGGVPFSYELRTDLKYLKVGKGQDAGRLLYELDDFKTFPGDGDGKVTIDHGYINVSALHPGTAKPGVRVVTRKVVRIEEFPPVLQKIWICALGYGHAAMEMIFGGVQGHYQNLTKWDDPPLPVAPARPEVDHGAFANTAPGQRGTEGPYSPKTAGALAVTMVADCLKDVTKDSAQIAEKWAKGQLQVTDLAQFSGELSSRLASDVWIFFDRLNKLPPPPTRPGSTH
jgi:hypothetical protein